MESYTLNDLSFQYPNALSPTLKNISFSIGQGEFAVLCGLSGCGKSTLLRQLKTCIQPHGNRSGAILFEGTPLSEVDFSTQSQKIGFVQQSPDNQSVTDKVWHELAFGLENLGLKNEVIRRRTAETASFFGIEKWFNHRVDELSGGQKQLLNLASVMVMQPSVLILDEPTAQLDPIATEDFLTMLRKINRELGTTILMTEHHLGEVFSYADRILVMSDGMIISDTSPSETAKFLFETQNEMRYALPSPVRIYEYIDGENTVPLSTAEGRAWLMQWTEKHSTVPLTVQPETVHTEKPVLELKEVYFRYSRDLPDVLKGLSLKAYAGEQLTILGGNGVGKTTMLTVLAGLQKAYRGKVSAASDLKMAVLPQNPQTLFVRETVIEDLYEIFDGTSVSKSEQKQRVQSMTEWFSLEKILDRHPYDLSGGEQQKAALAKLLLTEPNILLLDEPTKGLDTAYRRQLSAILKTLTENGVCIVTVTHDIDFCAESADRCDFFFDGKIISEGTPQEFFSENGIYTTSVCRMSKHIIDHAVTVNDILTALQSDKREESFSSKPPKSITPQKMKNEPPESKRFSLGAIFKGIGLTVLLGIFLGCMLVAGGMVSFPWLKDNPVMLYGTIFLSLMGFLFLCGRGTKRMEIIPVKRPKKYFWLSLGALTVLVPLTIFVGIYFFGDTKYLFISLLILFEIMLPFFVSLEKQKIQARELVLIATVCALCVTGRAVFYMLPSFKPVAALVILSGVTLGSETGFLVGAVTMLASNVFFGQGIWTPWQMFAMGTIGFLAGAVFNHKILPVNKISLSLFGFLAVLILYGGIMNPAAMFMAHTTVSWESLMLYYLSGIPVDLIHAAATAFFLVIGGEPILRNLERVKKKYGIIR